MKRPAARQIAAGQREEERRRPGGGWREGRKDHSPVRIGVGAADSDKGVRQILQAVLLFRCCYRVSDHVKLNAEVIRVDHIRSIFDPS